MAVLLNLVKIWSVLFWMAVLLNLVKHMERVVLDGSLVKSC